MQNRHKDIVLEEGPLKVIVSSNFDSGNLETAKILDNRLIITPALDPMNTQYSTKQSSKTFFHFSIESNRTGIIPVVIERMKILQYFNSEEQFCELYRICICRKKKNQKGFHYEKMRLKDMKKVEKDDSIELHFRLQILDEKEVIFLAYHFPYSYKQGINFIQKTQESINTFNQKQLSESTKIYFKKQLLIESIEGRQINLLTITQNNKKSQQIQPRVSKSLFPFYQLEQRPNIFSKPYILLTCRVHPGETSSSYALEGIINFLISNHQYAILLRKHFVFIVIPMLNPDGVFHGTYRMDTLGHNLNRFYNSALSHKQPSIFAVQTLIFSYSSRIIFYMDMHAHPHPNKGSFIYGNSYNQIQEQIQSQLYAKLLSKSCESFGYNWCSFLSSQMNSKDINETLSKDGSARVQIYKSLNLIFSYTLELGYHGCNIKTQSEEFYLKSSYKRINKIFTIKDYKQCGKSVMLTILSLFVFAPFQNNTSQLSKSIVMLRDDLYKEILEKEQKLRIIQTTKKIKIVNTSAISTLYINTFKKNPKSHNELQKITELLFQPEKQKIEKQKSISSNSHHHKSRTLDTYHSLERQKQLIQQNFEVKLKRNSISSKNYNGTEKTEDYKFAKKLNLNFNPFPEMQRQHLYSSINKKKLLKKQLFRRFQRKINPPEQSSFEMFPSSLISTKEQLVVIEIIKGKKSRQLCSPQKKDEKIDQNKVYKPSKILPSINEKTQKNDYNVEIQIQKQYNKKFMEGQQKELRKMKIKSSMRIKSKKLKGHYFQD